VFDARVPRCASVVMFRLNTLMYILCDIDQSSDFVCLAFGRCVMYSYMFCRL
jgi:hypothetical protein